MKKLAFFAVLLSMILLCQVRADDFIPLTLDYQAQTHAYAYNILEWCGQTDSRTDNDNSINSLCQSSAYAHAFYYDGGPGVPDHYYGAESVFNAQTEGIENLGTVKLKSKLDGWGDQYHSCADCDPPINDIIMGSGEGNGYTSLEGTLTVGQFPGYPAGSSDMILKISTQVSGNSSGAWQSHSWWLKIWTVDPNAPIAIIDQNNLSEAITISTGDILNIKLYQAASTDNWPAAGLNTNITVMLYLIVPNIADMSGDGLVNFLDYAFLAEQWGKEPGLPPADISGGDGVINFMDLSALAEIWLQTVKAAIYPAWLPNPADGATLRSRTLSWRSGYGALSHNVYFGSNFNEVNDANIANPAIFMDNQDSNSWNTNNYVAGLAPNTTYYWRIEEIGDVNTSKGNVWSFITDVVLPPDQASNPSPADAATNINVTTDLNWTAGSLATSHDVYLGTTNPPPFKVNQTGTTYDTGTMDSNVTYYWRIDEKNSGGTTNGNVWSFKTGFQLPEQASNPTPTNGAINFGITTNLSWTAGSLATSHDVYFGTSNPPPFIGNQSSTTYYTGIMLTNTTYYWRIDEKNASGTTTGNVWSFTPLIPGLVAEWKFDEGTGTTAYDFTGSNNGTIYGATWTTGMSGKALSFDGVNDYVSVSDSTSLDISSEITITAWIKLNNSDQYPIVGKQPSGTAGSGSAGNYYFETSPMNELAFFHQTSTGASGSYYYSNSCLTQGVWQHVAVTLGGGQVKFYKDGILNKTVTQSGTFGILNDEPVRIGARKDGLYFYGSIDDVRIYNRALTAAEIASVYQQSQMAPTAQAFNPSPLNGSTGISITTDLSWTADINAASHDVYFGTSNPPPFIGNQTATTYDTGTMNTNTT
ncbi:MAG: LamG-like jellyroll fold domain-containing protein, partial [Sedimentisphaerales bacterium]